MDGIKIVVPSKGRHEIMTTQIPGQILCVHKSEKNKYQEFHNCEIITHEEIGLSAIRQWIYQKFRNVFMVDDDIVSVERLFETKQPILSGDETVKIIQQAYQIAKELNTPLFGFNNTLNPKHYKPQKPFVANGYINACAFGLLKSDKLYFHKQTVACESHWINLLNAYHYRRSFQDTRYAFRQKPNSTFMLAGGQTSRRTLASEKRDTLFLRAMFGDSVQIKKGQNDASQLHQYQRKLNIPLWKSNTFTIWNAPLISKWNM